MSPDPSRTSLNTHARDGTAIATKSGILPTKVDQKFGSQIVWVMKNKFVSVTERKDAAQSSTRRPSEKEGWTRD